MKKNLNKEEREIEKSVESFRPVKGKKLEKIESILNAVRKTKNVNIRISEVVLEQLKQRSVEEGIPYQTLITSILHKYVNNKLLDERAIRQSLGLLSK